jgi:hypothetical protein
MSSDLSLQEQTAKVREAAERFGPNELEAFRNEVVEYSLVSDPIAIFNEVNGIGLRPEATEPVELRNLA